MAVSVPESAAVPETAPTRTPDPVAARRLAAGLALGALAFAVLAADVPFATIGVTLALAVALTVVLVLARPPARTTVLVVVLAAALLPWLVIRSSPWLVAADALALSVLVLGTLGSRRRPLVQSARGLVGSLFGALEGAAHGPGMAVDGARVLASSRGVDLSRWLPGALGAALAVVILGGLLASGDALFASFLDLGDFGDSLAQRLFLAGLGAVLVLLLVAAVEHTPPAEATSAKPWTSVRVAVPVLAAVAVVSVAYVAVQAAALALGPEYVERRTGLTYAEYARTGFFQLVTVAGLTLVLVALARPIARDASPGSARTVRILGCLVVVCTEVMVVVSIGRLMLYADAFGLTMLRLYTTVFAGWLGVVLLLAAVALWTGRREWLAITVVVLAFAGVVGMNVVDPEAVVARTNLASDAPQEPDLDYLATLSDDVVPTVVSWAAAADPQQRATVVDAWCPATPTGGLGWNRSAGRAEAALATICPAG